MRAFAVGTSVRSGPTALLGPGEAFDDYNVGQLDELIRVEQQLAGAIAATTVTATVATPAQFCDDEPK